MPCRFWHSRTGPRPTHTVERPLDAGGQAARDGQSPFGGQSTRGCERLPTAAKLGDTGMVAERVISNLRERRTATGLTQAQIAEAAGVTRQTIIAIEKGNYTPSVLLALKLARILGITVEELFAYVE